MAWAGLKNLESIFFRFFPIFFEKSKNEIFSKSTQDVLKHVKKRLEQKKMKKTFLTGLGRGYSRLFVEFCRA